MAAHEIEPLPASHLVKEGWLVKQGGSHKSWKRRWFRFTIGALRYYDKQVTETTHAKQKPKGEIPSRAIRNVEICEEGEVKYPFSFKVVTSQRTYFCSAASLEERKEWMSAIWEHVAHYQFPSMGRSSKGSVSTNASGSVLRPKLVVLRDYEPMDDAGLSVKQGERLELVSSTEAEWEVQRGEERGKIPRDVARISERRRSSSRSRSRGSRGNSTTSKDSDWHKPDHGILFTAAEGSVTRKDGAHTVWEPTVMKFIPAPPSTKSASTLREYSDDSD